MPVIKTDRDAIIKESIHLFKVNGYSQTTMAHIGKACGLIKGSIYHHFKSKEDLALACLKYIHELFERDIFAIAYRDNIPAQKRFEQFTKAMEEYFLHSEGGCLLGNFALEISNTIAPLKKEIIAYFDAWEEALFYMFQEKFEESLARDMSKLCVASTQGNIMMMRLYGDKEAFHKYNLETIKLLA